MPTDFAHRVSPQRRRPRLAIALTLALLTGCQSKPQPAPPIAQAPALPPRPVPAEITWSAIGHSHGARPILARTFPGGAQRVLVIGSIHGDEPWGREALERLLGLSPRQSGFSPRELHGAPSALTIRVILDVNPDGSAIESRTNARGIDLNRNFPARNFTPHSTRGEFPLSEPESAALHRDLLDFRPDVVVVLHGLKRGNPFVNYDGPAAGLAAAFAEAAYAHDQRWTVKPDMGYATPGSLGSFVGVDLATPILTVEFAPNHEAYLAETALAWGLDAVFRSLEHPEPVAGGSGAGATGAE